MNWYLDSESVCEDLIPDADGYTECQADLGAGTFNILLEVSDSGNNSGNDSIALTVKASTPPEANLISPFDGDRHFANEYIEFRGYAMDAEDGIDLEIWLESDLQGVLEIEPILNADGEFSTYGMLIEGSHLITLTAKDSLGYLGVDNHIIEVLPANMSPSIVSVDITPDPATADNELSCSYSGFSDPEGDPDLSTYEWFVNGVSAGSNTVLSGAFVFGDEVTCTVTPNDGNTDGVALSDSIIIQEFETWIDIAASLGGSCALHSTGTIHCIGTDSYGMTSNAPSGVFERIYGGGSHYCAMDSAGEISCWGWNEYNSSTPPSGSFVEMSAGYGHNCALDSSGYATCWGVEWDGRIEPPEVPYSTLGLGRAHSCGIDLQGEILCWGSLDVVGPAPTGTYVGVSSGSDYSCAWDANGEVTCWGQNNYGQTEPPAGPFIDVMTSGHRSCGLRTSGVIECWGGMSSTEPTPGPNDGPYVFLSENPGLGSNICAIKQTGDIECFPNSVTPEYN